MQSSAIPEVGLDVDHLCVLWCNQLVGSVGAALRGLVDPATKQLSADPAYRRAIIREALFPREPAGPIAALFDDDRKFTPPSISLYDNPSV